MGNAYSKPALEKRNNAVEEQLAKEATMDTSMGVPTERVATSPVDIYKNGIDDFKKFLNGEIYGGNLDERKKFQRNFINTIWAMLELDDRQVKEILDYFLITISKYPTVFDFNKLVAPLFSMESELPAADVLRYKRFMLFITMLAEHARDRQRFLANFDMVKFEAMFSPLAKQRLHTYVYR